jgi:hypothetical protein
MFSPREAVVPRVTVNSQACKLLPTCFGDRRDPDMLSATLSGETDQSFFLKLD